MNKLVKEVEEVLTFGRVSRIILGFFGFIFAGMFYLSATTDPGGGYPQYIAAFFCLLVVGAALLPKSIRGYCGDLIAVSVIVLVVFNLSMSSHDSEPASYKDAIKAAFIFGGLSVVYLVGKYKHVLLRHT